MVALSDGLVNALRSWSVANNVVNALIEIQDSGQTIRLVTGVGRAGAQASVVAARTAPAAGGRLALSDRERSDDVRLGMDPEQIASRPAPADYNEWRARRVRG